VSQGAQPLRQTPGCPLGLNQVNVRVPSGAASGNNVPIILKVGFVGKPASATLAVKVKRELAD